MKRVHKLIIIGLIVTLAAWPPIGYSGLPKTNSFSIHTIYLIDAGIISYQPWADQNGVVHAFREYGWANLQWNTSNIVDGYQVESYNFSTIPNVTFIDWDFHALIAKVQNGVPVYEDVFPNINGPIYPFDHTSFQIQLQSFKSYHAVWQANSTIYYSDPAGNITSNLSDWPDADYGLRSQIETNVTEVLHNVPSSGLVDVNFTANWNLEGTVSSVDANLRNYGFGFDRAASVSMLIRNGTLLSGSATFYVLTVDGPTVGVVYRVISVPNAIYATIGIAFAALTVSLTAFRGELKKLRLK